MTVTVYPDLPDPNDRDAVAMFASSFNGYDHFGTFEAAAQAAASKRRLSLEDLRNELFMAFRGSVHRGDNLFLETYRELLPFFEVALRDGEQG